MTTMNTNTSPKKSTSIPKISNETSDEDLSTIPQVLAFDNSDKHSLGEIIDRLLRNGATTKLITEFTTVYLSSSNDSNDDSSNCDSDSIIPWLIQNGATPEQILKYVR